MSEYTVTVVPRRMLDFVWDQCEPLIERVAKRAPDDIVTAITKQNLFNDAQRLIIISKGDSIYACHVLDVRTLDSGKNVLYISISAGEDMEEWLDDFHQLCEAIAKEHNCIELRGLACRKGWMKKLQPYGWSEQFTTIGYKVGE